jgi:hypothetical protein
MKERFIRNLVVLVLTPFAVATLGIPCAGLVAHATVQKAAIRGAVQLSEGGPVPYPTGTAVAANA